MVHEKSKELFSTITFKDNLFDDQVLLKIKAELLSTKYVSYCLIQETGAYGKNNHLHLYVELFRAVRTDHFTAKLRKYYSPDSTTNRYTVKTLKEKDKIYRLGYYFQKEQDKVLHCHKNVDLDAYAREYTLRETTAQKLIIRKNHTHYTLNQLPSVYLAYCDSNKLDRNDYSKVYAHMFRDGYITVTQFSRLKYVTHGLKLLIDIDMNMDAEITFGNSGYHL